MPSRTESRRPPGERSACIQHAASRPGALHQVQELLCPCGALASGAGNEIIGLLKGTSVVYVTSIGELFHQAQVIHGRNGRVIPLLLVATSPGPARHFGTRTDAVRT